MLDIPKLCVRVCLNEKTLEKEADPEDAHPMGLSP